MNVHAVLATGVNGEGYREVLGVQFAGEDGADWLAFLRDLTARGLTGVKLVTGDAPRKGDLRNASRRGLSSRASSTLFSP